MNSSALLPTAKRDDKAPWEKAGAWFDTSNHPAWADSLVAAYRVHEKFDGLVYWQRHEWRYRDGHTWLDEWIRSSRNHGSRR